MKFSSSSPENILKRSLLDQQIKKRFNLGNTNKDLMAWSSDSVVNYYLSHRREEKDLYRSERVYVETAIKASDSILDIGCAAGGFSCIVKKFNPSIAYTGIDISPRMINEAKKQFPDDSFHLIDGKNIEFADYSFDTVISLGVMHMTENWEELFREAWRICKRFMIFDVRIVEDRGIRNPDISYQKLEFGSEWDGYSKAPYIILNIDEFMSFVQGLRPTVKHLYSYGYFHPVSEMTISIYDNICMAVFSLEKGISGKGAINVVKWNLPVKYPAKKAV